MTNQQTTRQQPNGRPAPAQPAPVPSQPATAAPPIQAMGAPAGQAPLAPTPSVNVYTESPASMNVKFIYRGADLMITLRESNGTALLDKLDAVLDRIERMGGVLKTARGGQAQGEASAPATGGMATGEAPPVCQYHGPMKPSTKKPGSFYCPAKMGDGSYCKEKVG